MPTVYQGVKGKPVRSEALTAGFRRAQWRMLLVTMFCYAFYYTGRQNFGFVVKALREDLHLSATAIGSVGAAMLLAYGAGQAINGGLGDMAGARRLVALGALLSVALNWITSFGNSYLTVLLPNYESQ